MTGPRYWARSPCARGKFGACAHRVGECPHVLLLALYACSTRSLERLGQESSVVESGGRPEIAWMVRPSKEPARAGRRLRPSRAWLLLLPVLWFVYSRASTRTEGAQVRYDREREAQEYPGFAPLPPLADVRGRWPPDLSASSIRFQLPSSDGRPVSQRTSHACPKSM